MPSYDDDLGRRSGIALQRTRSSRERAAAVAATLGIAAACWVLAVRQMDGMDMGPATEAGSFTSFLGLWVAMMAAMMLPGSVRAVLRHVRARGRASSTALFIASYLAVWTLIGVVAYPAYRPHGSLAAGAVVIAAGIYELTPLKQRFRTACRASLRSGVQFGFCCVGASIGLMATLLAIGAMNLAWMTVVAVVVLAQKFVPARATLDVPVALALVALGIWITVAPGSVPGFTPPM